MIAEGEKAPDLTAPSTAGEFRVSDYTAAGALVLLFYVKADTPG